MKRIILTGVLLLIAGSLVWMAYIFYPRTVDFEAQGMKYRLGSPGAAEERLLKVSIKGKVYRSFNGDRTFKGRIDLEGEEIPERAGETESKKFRGIEYYWILYHYADKDGKPRQHMMGNLFMNDDFSKIAIAMFDHEEDRTGWSGDSGLMVAAPASNREEAVALSNEIMREYLNGYVLK